MTANIITMDTFRAMSLEIGNNFCHIQSAGGNTSIKTGDKLAIKASGKKLINSYENETFVTVNLQLLLEDFFQYETFDAKQFSDPNSGLRPSIETLMHAVIPYKIVVHTHYLHALKYGTVDGGKDLLRVVLSDFEWVFIDYKKPGIELARAIAQNAGKNKIFFLKNHGLTVAGDDCFEVMQTMRKLEDQLKAPTECTANPNLVKICNMDILADFFAPASSLIQDMAFSSRKFTYVTGGALFPDQVVFLGPALIGVTELGELPATLTAQNHPVVIVFGHGVYVNKEISEAGFSVLLFISHLANILLPGRVGCYLSEFEVQHLMCREDEEYRRKL